MNFYFIDVTQTELTICYSQKNKLCTSAIFIGNIYSRRNINSGQNLYSGRNIYSRLDFSGRDILQQDLKQQIQSCITKQALLP